MARNLWEVVNEMEKNGAVSVEVVTQKKPCCLIEKLGFSFNAYAVGSLLDNYLYSASSGEHSLILAERYVNPNMSEYVAIYGYEAVICNLWDEFFKDYEADYEEE